MTDSFLFSGASPDLLMRKVVFVVEGARRVWWVSNSMLSDVPVWHHWMRAMLVEFAQENNLPLDTSIDVYLEDPPFGMTKLGDLLDGS